MTPQSIRSNWQVVCKDANAEIKYSYSVLPMQIQMKLICEIFHFAFKIQQNFTI